jgi:hypothetical protein
LRTLVKNLQKSDTWSRSNLENLVNIDVHPYMINGINVFGLFAILSSLVLLRPMGIDSIFGWGLPMFVENHLNKLILHYYSV